MLPFERFAVFQVNLDPTIGSEIAKTRPCVIVSPREMNEYLQTVIMAPLTSTIKRWPSRVEARWAGKKGEIALDQIRAVDKRRLTKKLGVVDALTQAEILVTLSRMFAE